MKVTVTIEGEIADIGGLAESLAGYLGGAKPPPWTNVWPHVSVPASEAGDPKDQTPVNVDASPSHTWEIKNAKPHPPSGED